MRRTTGERRGRLCAVVALIGFVLGGVPLSAQAVEFSPDQIVFPVIGEVTVTDSFGDPRSGGRIHEGVDIMGQKMQPVVAAADGVVDWIGSTCCYLSIDHGNGWETWYIHLNNDTPGTDDGAGWGIADGIAVGVPVSRGQLIGWVGDSGNAEDAGAHLHFEIRKDGVALDPYPALLAAPRLQEPGAFVSQGGSGQFIDDDGSVHEADIERLFSLGITRGCDATQTLYCPFAEITRGEMAAFLNRTLGLAPGTGDSYADDDGSQFEADIDAVTEAGIGFGCTETEYCPDRPLRRDEMAELLVRAFGFASVEQDFFSDDTSSAFQDSINALRQAGITNGCSLDDSTLYCPDRHLTRAEMASFFIRSLDATAG